jgi:glycosyltransferase involved in cell wall biosynthesis
MSKRLLYIANIRMPTEKAHGLQIMQNCEAFAKTGASVTLWAARRVNTPEMRAVRDAWAFYGVQQNFEVRHLPCIDLIVLVPDRADMLARLIFYLQLWTFALVALVRSPFARADILYSRDALVVSLLGMIHRPEKIAYEVHRLANRGAGSRLQTQAIERAGTVIAITEALREDLVKRGADPARIIVAHDGVRAGRFAGALSKEEARRELNWPLDAFIVGYVGRLHTLTMDKGVGVLIEALRNVRGVALAIVGGPDEMVAALQAHWEALRLDPTTFLYDGQVPPDKVPVYLAAFDVCAMPHPHTPHFARHTSPLKLFEYMASRRPIVASDLPGFAEVLRDGVTALLVPPGDAAALTAALTRLRDNPDLSEFLADSAYNRVMSRYTWDERAKLILAAIDENAKEKHNTEA